MPWQNTGIAKPIPEELSNLLATAGGVLSALNPLLETIKTLLQIAQAFYSGVLDPLAALAQDLLTEAENIVNDFFGTGVYMLNVDAVNRSGIVKYDSIGLPLLTPGQAISLAIDSLDDTGDIARPQFSNSANICAFGLMATAPSVDQFLALIQQLRNLFTMPDWELIFTIANRHRTVVSGVPTPPDWKSLRFNSIPEMKALQDACLDLIQMLKGYAVVPDNNLQDLIDIIDQKISLLQDLLDSIDSLINDLRNTTGIFVMNMPIGVGGNERLKQFLRDCPLERSNNQYTIMAVFAGGGPSLQPVDNIRKLIV